MTRIVEARVGRPNYSTAGAARAKTRYPNELTSDGVTDHGALIGLSDDDHTIYSKADGTRAFTGTVSGVTPSAAAHLTTKTYVDGLWAGIGETILLRDTSSLDVDDPSEVIVTWNTEDEKDAEYTHSTSTNAGEVMVENGGTYLVSASLLLVGTAAARWNGFLKLQKDTGAGFNDTNYQQANCYIRQQDNHNTSGLTLAVVIKLDAGDKLRLVVERESMTTATSVVNQSESFFSITKLL